MRTAILTIVGFLLVGAALLTFWPTAAAISQTPPGQYPIQQSRWQWPATVREAPYHPRKGMGSNVVAFTDAPALKVTTVLS